MKPALQDLNLDLPNTWSDLPSGELIQQKIEQHLNAWWPKIFGYHMLKLGALSAEIDASVCTIKHQVNVGFDTSNSNHKISVQADIQHLPFSENAVDAVLLTQVLDFAHDPHQILREAHRALIPNGYILISGFNPLSLTNAVRFMPGLKRNIYHQARFFSPNRITDWLNLLGCEVISDERFIYNALGFRTDKITNKSDDSKVRGSWLPKIIHPYLRKLGSVYLIVARKRELPLTPTKPKWKLKPKLQAIPQARQIPSRKQNLL